MKKFFSVMLLAAILFSNLGTASAEIVYMGQLESGTDIYIDDDSIYGEPDKFSVTMYFDDEPVTAIFSASGMWAMMFVGGQGVMVNGNEALERAFYYCSEILEDD